MLSWTSRRPSTGSLTVDGELNEVGANIAIGAAGRACTTTATTATTAGSGSSSRFLCWRSRETTYGENFSPLNTLFDGTTVRI